MLTNDHRPVFFALRRSSILLTVATVATANEIPVVPLGELEFDAARGAFIRS